MPNERTVAEMVIQLGRASCQDNLGGLTAAQWTALRFFSRANRFSRTVSGFAEFHLTTKGTASQTIKSLVSRGLLTRTRSDRDGRSVTMDLTASGRAMLARDPFEVLVNAVARLPDPERDQLQSGLARVLEDMVCMRGKRRIGGCAACACLLQSGEAPICRLAGEPLDREETGQICINFRPGQLEPPEQREDQADSRDGGRLQTQPLGLPPVAP